ncbi:rhodanese-like domain-containing protein [Hydrogenophaga sp. H7]|uniref:rhodanese-like domain-containing protein n=1 Tax=Hydrogenophaga sp. H7 TaxID=1882399 RepID=UPI00117BBBB1|nr:rhodanese-like domain-containing protein [Hydrogenophaga sp. H7]
MSDSSVVCTTQARQQALSGEAWLVDVREAADSGPLALDLPGVICMPWSELPARWQELPADRELVTVCLDGRLSSETARFLRDRGLSRVTPMRGGLLLWMQKGYAVAGRRYETPAANAATRLIGSEGNET